MRPRLGCPEAGAPSDPSALEPRERRLSATLDPLPWITTCSSTTRPGQPARVSASLLRTWIATTYRRPRCGRARRGEEGWRRTPHAGRAEFVQEVPDRGPSAPRRTSQGTCGTLWGRRPCVRRRRCTSGEQMGTCTRTLSPLPLSTGIEHDATGTARASGSGSATSAPYTGAGIGDARAWSRCSVPSLYSRPPRRGSFNITASLAEEPSRQDATRPAMLQRRQASGQGRLETGRYASCHAPTPPGVRPRTTRGWTLRVLPCSNAARRWAKGGLRQDAMRPVSTGPTAPATGRSTARGSCTRATPTSR
ncbi:hypothetical protein Pla86_41080 [Planctomycetes bacterium Pla86]|uniref:Uncharacterized protein n=1 Tax=Engelhardtia mirabilis TaxID=2528011 RepID=A0A518BPX5_9BACT|nr:hypothetical protein Pla133_41090 [Planctomycetes bacterium Pla133]QDV03320.1 hypothetical protein Pla86_41080 [Planctomycetes bacterium Pla86]